MSTFILSACWELTGMSSTQKIVLISLADQANDEGVCWPSIKSISKRSCLTERAVRNALEWLKKAKILEVQQRFNSSNVYKITTKNYLPPEQCTPPELNSPTEQCASTPECDAVPPCTTFTPPLNNVPPNLHINQYNIHTNNTHEKKSEQAIVDELTKETSVNFLMHFDWQPNQQEFLGYCKNFGVDPKKLSAEILGKFVNDARANQQKHNESKWCKFLAMYLKKWADNPQFDKQPNQHIYRPNGHSQPEQPMRYEVPNKIKVDTSNRESDEVRARMAKSLDSLIFGAA